MPGRCKSFDELLLDHKQSKGEALRKKNVLYTLLEY